MDILNYLLCRFLGAPVKTVSDIDGIHVEFAVTLSTAVIATIIGVSVLLALSYLRTQEPITFGKRFVLGMLRLIGMLLIAACIIGTTLVLDVRQEQAQKQVFYIDQGGSMALLDKSGTRSRIAAANAAVSRDNPDMAELRTHAPVEIRFAPAAETPMAPEGSLPKTIAQSLLETNLTIAEPVADTDGTDAEAPAMPPPDDVKALVILSDFNDPDPQRLIETAAFIAENGGTVNTVGLGSETPVDVEVIRLIGSPYAYMQDYIQLIATIRVTGADTEQLTITFLVDDKKRDTREVTVDGDPFVTTVSLSLEADVPGAHLYTVAVDPIAGEEVKGNNRRSTSIRTIDDKIRVLFIENTPRWEFRHIKRALEVDPVVAGTFYCRIPRGIGWYCQGVGGRKDPYVYLSNAAAGPPTKRNELFQYQVVILGDWGKSDLDIIPATNDGHSYDTALHDFVRRRGGGLWMIGGTSALSAGNLIGTPLEKVSPVSFDVEGGSSGPRKTRTIWRKRNKAVEFQIDEEFRLKITDEGLMHPIFMLESDAATNRKVWENMAKLDGVTKLGKAKEGASVLAVYPKTGMPVIAAWRYGAGKAMVNGADTTHLWRLGMSEEAQEKRYYERWISQIVRWCSPDPLKASQKVMIVPQDSHFEANKPVRIRVSLVDRHFIPINSTKILFRFIQPDGKIIEYIAENMPEKPGTYEATFLPHTAGRYQVAARDLDGDTGEDQIELEISLPPSELSGAALNRELAEKVAKAGNGKHVTLEQFPALLKELGTDTRSVTREMKLRLASAPGILILIMLCFACEWFIRKRNGLP